MAEPASLRPPSPGPAPSRLRHIKSAVRRHPSVARVGLTTTEDGRWALKVWLRRGARPPLAAGAAGAEQEPGAGGVEAEIEAMTGGYPVVYDEEPASPPVARPAYPGRGE